MTRYIFGMTVLLLLGCSISANPVMSEGLADDANFEIDLSKLPVEEERSWEFKIKIETGKFRLSYGIMNPKGQADLEAVCEAFALGFGDNDYKVTYVKNSKLQVYGRTKDGMYLPAIKVSIVEVKGLKKSEIPKVKSLKKKA